MRAIEARRQSSDATPVGAGELGPLGERVVDAGEQRSGIERWRSLSRESVV
ncbi:MAG: hypothetical protein R2709_15440 [Marmoricola sp.]